VGQGGLVGQVGGQVGATGQVGFVGYVAVQPEPNPWTHLSYQPRLPGR